MLDSTVPIHENSNLGNTALLSENVENEIQKNSLDSDHSTEITNEKPDDNIEKIEHFDKKNLEKQTKSKLSRFENVAIEQLNDSNKNPPKFILEEIREIFNDYIKISSKSIQFILENRALDFDNEAYLLKLCVASPFEKDSILSEKNLLENIRRSQNNPAIQFNIEIDQSLIKNIELNKPMSPHQKLEILTQKNPLIIELIDEIYGSLS